MPARHRRHRRCRNHVARRPSSLRHCHRRRMAVKPCMVAVVAPGMVVVVAPGVAVVHHLPAVIAVAVVVFLSPSWVVALVVRCTMLHGCRPHVAMVVIVIAGGLVQSTGVGKGQKYQTYRNCPSHLNGGRRRQRRRVVLGSTLSAHQPGQGGEKRNKRTITPACPSQKMKGIPFAYVSRDGGGGNKLGVGKR